VKIQEFLRCATIATTPHAAIFVTCSRERIKITHKTDMKKAEIPKGKSIRNGCDNGVFTVPGTLPQESPKRSP
jgi:hypothetical protein